MHPTQVSTCPVQRVEGIMGMRLSHTFSELTALADLAEHARASALEFRAWEIACTLDELSFAYGANALQLRAASLILRTNTSRRETAPHAFRYAAKLVAQCASPT